MKYIKCKAIQLKSWVLGNIRGDDGKISAVKTFYFFSGWFGATSFAVFLLQVLVWGMKIISFVLPYGIRFIEGLISALSYSLNKKELF